MSTIANDFAEALGHIEAAAYYLAQVNEQYDPAVHFDRRSRFCNPAMDFWLQSGLAEQSLKDRLSRLQRVEPLAPKEKEPGNIGGWSERMQELIEAIGRHPAAEDDAEVADAVNAIQDALADREKERTDATD